MTDELCESTICDSDLKLYSIASILSAYFELQKACRKNSFSSGLTFLKSSFRSSRLLTKLVMSISRQSNAKDIRRSRCLCFSKYTLFMHTEKKPEHWQLDVYFLASETYLACKHSVQLKSGSDLLFGISSVGIVSIL